MFREEDKSFSGIQSNEEFSNAIQKSFANQQVTMARIVDKERVQLTFQCISCSVFIVEELGDYSCPYCGGLMEEGI